MIPLTAKLEYFSWKAILYCFSNLSQRNYGLAEQQSQQNFYSEYCANNNHRQYDFEQ